MVNVTAIGNLTGNLPGFSTLVSQLSNLATIFKALGGLMIVYIVLYIFYLLLLKKKVDRLEEIKKIVSSIDKRLKEKNKKKSK